jgi:hypothetical protein
MPENFGRQFTKVQERARRDGKSGLTWAEISNNLIGRLLET